MEIIIESVIVNDNTGRQSDYRREILFTSKIYKIILKIEVYNKANCECT